MAKHIIFILIAIVLSAFAATQFLAQLERASATKARRDEDHKRRSLEFGWKDKTILTAVFALVMIILGLLSKFWLISTIIALAISVLMVIFNTYLKKNGISIFITLFLLWVGNLIASIKEAGFMTSTTGWGKVYILLQVVALVLLLVGSFAGNICKFYCLMKQENKDADKIARKVKATHSPDTEDGSDGDEGNDDGDGSGDEDSADKDLLTKAIMVVGIVIIIAAAFVIGYWLEMKFDFFPPYRS